MIPVHFLFKAISDNKTSNVDNDEEKPIASQKRFEDARAWYAWTSSLERERLRSDSVNLKGRMAKTKIAREQVFSHQQASETFLRIVPSFKKTTRDSQMFCTSPESMYRACKEGGQKTGSIR